MSIKIGSLIIDIEGLQLSDVERDLIAHPIVGGIILFKRNFESQAQLKALCASIRSTTHLPRIIMVDQEGGRVQRFLNGFTKLPSAYEFGQLYDQNKTQAISGARDCGWLMATELIAHGIDLSLAPVLDLDKAISKVIGSRAFHRNASSVSELAEAFICGMHDAGMAACGKHFPGHGSIGSDSHFSQAQDTRTYEQIASDDIKPFKYLIEKNIPAIMTSHIIFPAVDQQPVTYSSCWLKHVLRDSLKFKGVIVSDDLSMEGANIAGNYADRVRYAKEAGCDFTLLCNQRSGVIKVLDQLNVAKYLISEEKWLLLQCKVRQMQDYRLNEHWQKAHDLLINMPSTENTSGIPHQSIFCINRGKNDL